MNQKARVRARRLPVTADRPELDRGQKILAVEDGPTLTHGGMRYGAACVAAKAAAAPPSSSIPARMPSAPSATRIAKYPNAVGILPAMGYGDAQIAELEETIRRTPCDVVVIGTPIDLTRVLKIDKPAVPGCATTCASGFPGASKRRS